MTLCEATLKGNVLAAEGGICMGCAEWWWKKAGYLQKGALRWTWAFAMALAVFISGRAFSFEGDAEFAANAAVQSSPLVPGGTVLPIALEKTTRVKEAQAGQPIDARIMQEVPLPSGEKIPFRSIVKGSIVSVVNDEDEPGVKLTLKFNQVETKKENLTVVTYLRAIASYNAVRAAQTPNSGADVGVPAGWANTLQIGGDVRFGDGGAVRGRGKQKVGKGVRGGVLVYVKANPTRGCDGPVGDDRPQALWVFSADACGVYDLNGLSITRKGKAEPVGEVTLHFEKDDMKLEAGTAVLLRVIMPQP
jgi:hypothetical protein